MGDDFYWDLIRPELAGLFTAVWGEPTLGLNRRQTTGTLFAMRALRRVVAIDALFASGLYAESHMLVRAAYEDWLQIAYLLREPGDSRCNAFEEAVHKLDARVYDAFTSLCGKVSADRYFGELPAAVAPFVGLPRSQTQTLAFSAMADDVGLRGVHDFVYAYLSGLSHPDGRMNKVFDMSEEIAVAAIPQRDASEETRQAIWFAWFTSRTEILAASEFGVDHEPFVEECLLPLRNDLDLNLETCVLVRERQDL